MLNVTSQSQRTCRQIFLNCDLRPIPMPRLNSKLSNSIPGLEPHNRCLARLSARSGMLADLNLLLDQGGASDPGSMRALVLDANLLARGTSNARKKLYVELKARYLLDPQIPIFAHFLQEWRNSASQQEKHLLAFTLLALNDLTVMLASREWLFPRLRKADSELRVVDLESFLSCKGKENHPEISRWTPATLRRVAQHYLATVRDCGMATGTIKKLAFRPALYAAPMRLLLQALLIKRVSLPEIITHESFKILGIAPGEVVGALSELNRHGAIKFRQQADVIELAV